jgi:serine protease Do
VTPDGPASEAGVERGDVITAFDGQPVDDSNGLRNLVAAARPGADVEVELLRDGKREAVTVRLGTRPGEVAAASTPGAAHEEATVKLGLAVQPLTGELADELGYAGQQGVLVAEVLPGTPAADTALRRGDLLKRINRTEIRDVDDVRSATAELNEGDHVALLVQRGETTFFVGLQLTT